MKRLFIFIILISISSFLFSQNLLRISNDPAIVTGKTSNGLTFYLVNDAASHKGFADFLMVQKWGTSVESLSEEGLTSLLTGMNLLDSRGFPDGTLFKTLRNLGIPLASSLVYKVEADDVIMGLKDVPVSNQFALDEVLSALINMCSGAEINDATVISGRSFQYHRSAYLEDLDYRVRTNLLKELFPEYDHLCPDIEAGIENVYTTPINNIWDFQKKWFKPQTQALIIVGDVDVNSMKSKISLLSQTLPRGGQTSIPSDTLKLKIGDEAFHTYIDREADRAYLRVDFLQKTVNPAERSTHIAIVKAYITTLLNKIIQARIDNLTEDVPFPVLSSEVTDGDFSRLNETDVLSIKLSTTPDRVPEAAAFLSSFIAGLTKGISETELRNATDWYQSQVSRPQDYTSGIIRHFLKGYSFPSSKEKSEYAAKLGNSFGTGQMNAYIASYLENDTYRIISCTSPHDISDNILRESYEKGRGTELIPSVIFPDASDSKKGGAVHIKAPVAEPITGSVIYTLPNYSKVYFKKNSSEPGQISILAISKGGLSVANKSYPFFARYIDNISDLSLPAIPSSKNIYLKREFTPDRTYLNGRCRAEDLDLFFQLVSSCFTGCHIDSDKFTRKMNELTLADVYGYASPENRFKNLSSGCMEPKKEFTPLDWQTVSNFINQTCSNIGNYTFLIAGDCSENSIKECIERYLAPIPGKRSQQTSPVGIFSPEPDGINSTVTMPMENPRHIYGLRLTDEITYSLPGIIISDIVSALIRQKVEENLFAEGILVTSTEERIAKPRNLMSLEFMMSSPDDLSFFEQVLNKTLDELEEEGVPYDRIDAARRYVAATYSIKSATGNDYWIEMMETRLNGKDFISQRDATLSALTYGEINNALKFFINSASRKTTRIKPETFVIPELPPIEFEDPFPEPLEISFELPALPEPPAQTDSSSEIQAETIEEQQVTVERTDTVSVNQAVIIDTSDK